MQKFGGYLLCTDLDGTLFADDKSLSRENLDAIESFKAEGGRFTFITGRVPLTVCKVADLVRPNAPIGCLNGGGMYDLSLGKYIWNRTLSNAAWDLIDAVAAEMPDVGVQLNCVDGLYYYKDNLAMERFRALTNTTYRPCPHRAPPSEVLKVVLAHQDSDRLLALERLLRAHPLAAEFDFIRSEHTLFEILPKGVSKGALLSRIAEHLSIPMAHTVAIGDYHNDISMVQAAGLGIAVANAVDELKAVADAVTVSNNAHAIAAAIELLRQRK